VRAAARLGAGVCAGLAAVAGPPELARASGFLLVEQSAEALGKAGAVTAAAREPAAVWFNPAALAVLPGAGAAITAAIVRHGTSFEPRAGGGAVASEPGTSALPNLFAHAPVRGAVAAGIGLYAPFGLAVDWPAGWLGEQHALATRIWAVAANPVAAVRLPAGVSIGGGASLVRGGVRLRTALPREVGGEAELAGGAWGFGANAAVLWQPRPDAFAIGATYRSRVALPFRGTADFSPAMAGTAQVPAQIFQDGPARADLTLPDVITVGVMGRPHPRLELSADAQYALWRTFDRLVVDFEYGGTPDTIFDRRSRDPFTGRVGAEWRWPERSLALRAGALYDQSATPSDTLSPATPDAHRVGLTLGVGYVVRRFKVDVGYMYLHFLPAEAAGCVRPGDDGAARDPLSGSRCPPEGTYQTRVHAVAVTVAVR
jgi:long-chain fatty acid transport protein